MRAYNFTAKRKKVFTLHASGMDIRDIAKEMKISATRAQQIVKRILENVPKEQLEKIKRQKNEKA